MDRKVFSDYRVALDTALIVGSIVAVRGLLFALGIDGMSLSPLTSSIVAGGVFVMGLVVAGTLSDYKEADRAPGDLATVLYAILRECESTSTVWGLPNMTVLRRRLIGVVTGSEGVAADEVTEQAAEVEEYLADVEAEDQEA
jgi:hypothetical protein